ncbi:hypothetical protein T12_2277 [Trichinella patagoniensis]|uniref:Uncharacterized protein n=1 Tax=Trichinella patagoniensis TaxID=990121 RepID=A0A0V0ZC42_9BILA|nr:hypothetical protein T12_2277 [Trichinella patagoniensis]
MSVASIRPCLHLDWESVWPGGCTSWTHALWERTLFAEQNQLIPHAALGPCYRDHGCQIAAIVIFREVLQKVRLRTKNTTILKCFVKRETSQHITEWKDGNAASNAEQLRVTVCQGSFVILSAFNLKRHRTATETLFIQLKI